MDPEEVSRHQYPAYGVADYFTQDKLPQLRWYPLVKRCRDISIPLSRVWRRGLFHTRQASPVEMVPFSEEVSRHQYPAYGVADYFTQDKLAQLRWYPLVKRCRDISIPLSRVWRRGLFHTRQASPVEMVPFSEEVSRHQYPAYGVADYFTQDKLAQLRWYPLVKRCRDISIPRLSTSHRFSSPVYSDGYSDARDGGRTERQKRSECAGDPVSRDLFVE
ncbi:hypothetical protein J6590_010519 [Homalodisca vitripennis]|nr:hypothetical protein J6590_010519 [Homalodisca vitripennis]